MRVVPQTFTDLLRHPLPKDNLVVRERLVRELNLASGFTIIIAIFQTLEQRAEEIHKIKRELPDYRIEEISLRQEVPHLLDVLRFSLKSPYPDAVFVYGIEQWLSGSVEPDTVPFILNLNASRNHFIRECPLPLVLWIPEYALPMLMEGAPDFMSARSGLHRYTDTRQPHRRLQEILAFNNHDSAGWLPEERERRREELEKFLVRAQNLPAERRDFMLEARTLNQIAGIYYEQGFYPQALILFQQHLQLLRSQPNINLRAVASGLNNLANLQMQMGKFAEAEPLMIEALNLREHYLGASHPLVAQSLDNLAGLYANTDQIEKAFLLVERALKIYQEVVGGDPLDIAMALNNLAFLYVKSDRVAEALPLVVRALETYENTLGKEHPEIVTGINNLAGIYQQLNRYSEAEPLYRRALSIREKFLEENHPNVATSLRNLGFFYMVTERYTEALPLLEKAFSIQRKSLGDDHADTQICFQNLLSCLMRLGREDEAERLSPGFVAYYRENGGDKWE